MFMGQYEHTIDAKGRMTIPVRYRDFLTDGAYITLGFDQNLLVMTNEDFMNISERIDEMSLTNPAARQLKRRIFAYAEKLDLDKAGRILIPGFLREHAELVDAATVVGMGAVFEIWSPILWSEESAELQLSDTDQKRFINFELPIRSKNNG
jgi:MraZ protein